MKTAHLLATRGYADELSFLRETRGIRCDS